MKLPNLILTTLILASLVVTGWLIWQDINQNRNITTFDVVNNAGESPIVAEGNPQIEVVNFQEQANGIINRPILISQKFPPEIEADLRRQISEIYAEIKMNHDNVTLWISLGQLRKVIGDYEGARDAWEFGGFIRPQNSLTYQNLGDLYGLYLNDMPKAEENYSRSILNDPGNISAYINAAELYWNSGETIYRDKIPGLLLGGLEKNTSTDNRVPLLGRLAKYYSDIGENQKSIYYYEEVLKIDTTYEDIVRKEIERLRGL